MESQNETVSVTINESMLMMCVAAYMLGRGSFEPGAMPGRDNVRFIKTLVKMVENNDKGVIDKIIQEYHATDDGAPRIQLVKDRDTMLVAMVAMDIGARRADASDLVLENGDIGDLFFKAIGECISCADEVEVQAIIDRFYEEAGKAKDGEAKQ